MNYIYYIWYLSTKVDKTPYDSFDAAIEAVKKRAVVSAQSVTSYRLEKVELIEKSLGKFPIEEKTEYFLDEKH